MHAEKIYAKLDEILLKLREVGYVADATSALNDTDEEQKRAEPVEPQREACIGIRASCCARRIYNKDIQESQGLCRLPSGI